MQPTRELQSKSILLLANLGARLFTR